MISLIFSLWLACGLMAASIYLILVVYATVKTPSARKKTFSLNGASYIAGYIFGCLVIGPFALYNMTRIFSLDR
jgi:MFS family permease